MDDRDCGGKTPDGIVRGEELFSAEVCRMLAEAEAEEKRAPRCAGKDVLRAAWEALRGAAGVSG